MSRHLVVFAKPPRPGLVKTRLAAGIGPEAAALLYAAFLEDTLDAVGRLPEMTRSVAWQPRGDTLPVPAGWRSGSQRGDDLGERMGAAFDAAFREGATAVVLIGSDSPTMPNERVTDAFERLGGVDCVLGPAEDGGYYLVGLSSPAGAIFRGVEWSTDGVLRQTLEKARGAGIGVELLEPWYDVDTVEDLARLRAELGARSGVAAATRRALAEVDRDRDRVGRSPPRD